MPSFGDFVRTTNDVRFALKRSSLFRTKLAVLAPGDKADAVLTAHDVYDYRGVARERDLGELGRDGISLGRYVHPRGKRGRQLRLPAKLLFRNAVVIGPPGSGKTEGIIIPWILELLGQGNSVVTVDVKGDLYSRLQSELGVDSNHSWYWAIRNEQSWQWNWFDELNDSRDIEAVVISVLGRKSPSDTQPFFYERNYRWLKSMIEVVKIVHGKAANPSRLYDLMCNQQQIRQLFRDRSDIEGLRNSVSDLLSLSPEEYGKALGDSLNTLSIFGTAEYREIGNRSEFSLADFARSDKRPRLLVIGAGLADSRTAEVLSSLMLNLLILHLYRRFEAGTGDGRDVSMIIDEAAHLKDRIAFADHLSLLRSARVGICLAIQDVTRLGEEREQSAILSNCSTVIVLTESSAASARFLSTRLGQHSVESVSLNQHNQSRSTTTAREGRPVLGDREIMYPPVITYGGIAHVAPLSSKPFLIDLSH